MTLAEMTAQRDALLAARFRGVRTVSTRALPDVIGRDQFVLIQHEYRQWHVGG